MRSRLSNARVLLALLGVAALAVAVVLARGHEGPSAGERPQASPTPVVLVSSADDDCSTFEQVTGPGGLAFTANCTTLRVGETLTLDGGGDASRRAQVTWSLSSGEFFSPTCADVRTSCLSSLLSRLAFRVTDPGTTSVAVTLTPDVGAPVEAVLPVTVLPSS